MRVQSFDNSADFLSAARSLLLKREAENNLLVGLLEWIKPDLKFILRVVRDDGDEPVAAALMTDPEHNLILSHASDAAIDALADSLARDGVQLPGVTGSLCEADRFAARWTHQHKLSARQSLGLGVYRLTRVTNPPRLATGYFKVPTAEDAPAIAPMIGVFCDSVGDAHAADMMPHTLRRIHAGTIFTWRDGGEIVAITGCSGQTPNGIRINLVYTPPQLRGRGYASSLVAAVSQKMLDSGRKFCFLFTDMANPTSNKIYRDVGYELVGEQKQIRFEPAK